MILESLPEVQKLSPEEKRQLADELLDEIEDGNHGELKPDVVALLNERLEDYGKDPSSARPWSDVRKAIGLLSES
ncbi:MAG: addiction module protein [Verrucomicrobiales bacterium]